MSDDQTPTSAETGTAGKEALPPEPVVSLISAPGHSDEASDRAVLTVRIDRLVERAAQSEDPIVRAELLLGAANHVLAHQIEPACTRELLGLPNATAGAASSSVNEQLNLADEWIAKAEKLLGENPSSEDEQAKRRDQALLRQSTLQAFSRALRGLLTSTAGDEAAAESRRAASGLSALLEHDDPRVAAAAGFWQSVLRARSGDVVQVMAALELPMSDPAKTAMPYAFFGRLLRCQIIGGEQTPATALVLLMQLEDRCADWFADDLERAAAERAVVWAQIQLLRRWYDKLSPETQAPERTWCVERIQRLTREKFASPGEGLLRIRPAIPIITSVGESPEGDNAAPGERK